MVECKHGEQQTYKSKNYEVPHTKINIQTTLAMGENGESVKKVEMSLPRYISLKLESTSKYLRFVEEDVQVHGFMQFSGEEVMSPFTKFEVENAQSGSGLVHIRSCYNNKYLQRRSKATWWIVGDGDEPDEDQSSWTCTLFKPEFVDGDATRVHLFHVQLGHHLSLSDDDDQEPFRTCLYAGNDDIFDMPKPIDVFTVIDWASLVVLPRYVVFKGDNGLYQRVAWILTQPHLQFSANDVGITAAFHEVFFLSNGDVRIRNTSESRFWRRNSRQWIVASSNDSGTSDLNTCFRPVRVLHNDNSIIALRNLGNNLFVMRYNLAVRSNCTCAYTSSIEPASMLEVGEPVRSRRIDNVVYRLNDARIYDTEGLGFDTHHHTNRTSEPNTIAMTFSTSYARTYSWERTISASLTVSTSISAGVPLLVGGSIDISFDFSGSYTWGTTIEEVITRENVYTVTVPPMTEVKVQMLATRGKCDVPFNYRQTDILTNGQTVAYNKTDGIYTGVNSYNFRYVAEETPL